MKHEKLIKNIIENLGGKENVTSIVQGITRLKVKLKDKSKANIGMLKNMNEIIRVIQINEQIHIIIQHYVSDIFKEIIELEEFQYLVERTENKKKECLKI